MKRIEEPGLELEKIQEFKNRKEFYTSDNSAARTIQRELRIEEKPEDSSRSVELSFSSDRGIERYDWWDGEWFREILDHSPEAVLLDRLRDMGVALFNHDVNKPVGRLENVRVEKDRGEGKKGRCRIVFDDDEESEKVFRKVKSGTLKGVSVGYRVYEWQDVRAGKSTDDGIEGPAMIARKWEPIEVSVVSCPADASVGIGRSFEMKEESRNMDGIKEQIRSAGETVTGVVEDAPITRGIEEVVRHGEGKGNPETERKADADKPAADDIAMERARASEISAVCARFGLSSEETARFIQEGTPLVDVYRSVTKKAASSPENQGIPASCRNFALTETGEDDRKKYRSRATDGQRLRMGISIPNPVPGADEFRYMSLLELARDVLERNGERNARKLAPMETAERAFSTSDFPAIMGNLADTTLQAAYTEVPSTWRAWCRIGTATDFKEQHLVRMGTLPELEPVLEGGEYKMADLMETEDSFSIGTFGKKFALTRQAIINDDLGAFMRIPQLFGAASARTVNRAVYSKLKSNPKVKEDNTVTFHTSHNNLGTAAALSIPALNTARIAMRRQTGLRKGDQAVTLNLSPAFLIIPPELETLANQILYSDTDIRGDNPAVKNPFRNAFAPIVEAELDPWEWYLAASPSVIDTIEVAFLGGAQNPTLEQKQGWNVDGIEYKVRLDFGVWLYEYRGLYKNPGADPNASAP